MSSSQDLEFIRKRFDTNFSTLETKIKSLTPSQLFGIWSEEFPKLLNDILESLKTDLNERVFTSRDEEIEEILPTLNHRLDYFASLIETILNTLCKNTSIHEYVSWVLRDMEFAKKVPYIICMKQSLETIQIVASCKLYFKGPLYSCVNETLDKYKDQYDDFSILSIPPTVLANKKYWSLIIHEIGHILNDIDSLTENYNVRVERGIGFTQDFRNYYHGREFVSDYIANVYCGPVYFESISEYLNELDVLPQGWEYTHPHKDARLYFLQEVSGKKIDNPKVVDAEPTIDKHNLVENLDEIIKDTDGLIFEGKTTIYKEDTAEIKNATTHLSNLIPYIGSPRVLLNAYAKNLQEIVSKIKEKTKQEDQVIIDNIGIIIEDSIRLSNMERTFNFKE